MSGLGKLCVNWLQFEHELAKQMEILWVLRGYTWRGYSVLSDYNIRIIEGISG